ncbi:MAG TPA: hypothetical protein DCX53_17180 [Anaerolineae bacterium]|nr:hypothetical protein [Anaerolineae bacterium]
MLISTFLGSLYDKVLVLGNKKYWFLGLGLVFLVVVVINGIAIVPQEPYQRLSENPFSTRTDIHFWNYFQETLLLPVIANFLKLTSPLTFNLLCMLIIIGGYSLFAFLVFHRWGASVSLIFSTLLITSPLTTVILTWLGMPDGLTLALLIPLLFTNSFPLIFSLTVFGAANHFIFIIAAIEIFILRWLIRDTIDIRHLLLALIGGLTGLAVVQIFHNSYQIEVVSRSSFVLLKSMEDWLALNVRHLPMSVFSLFNMNWFALIVCYMMFFKQDKRFYLAVLFILNLNYGITFFSLDTTRIFSMLSWGVFATVIFHSYRIALDHSSEHKKQFLQALILIGIISIFTPRYFSWAGDIHTTPFYDFLKRLIL